METFFCILLLFLGFKASCLTLKLHPLILFTGKCICCLFSLFSWLFFLLSSYLSSEGKKEKTNKQYNVMPVAWLASNLAKSYDPVIAAFLTTRTNSFATAKYTSMSCCIMKLDRAIAIVLFMIELRRASNIALRLASQTWKLCVWRILGTLFLFHGFGWC